jgi:hypothetical protein
MRLHSLYLTGALLTMAIPLSAGAQLLQANEQPTPDAQTYFQWSQRCPAGWVWEQPGYLSSGKWRPSHCAPRNIVAY